MAMTSKTKQAPAEETIAVVSENPPVAPPATAPAVGGGSYPAYTPSYAPTVDLGNGMSYTDYYQNLSPSLQNERRALLATMAEYGMDGHMHWERQRKAVEQARAASHEKTAARGAAVNAPRALGTELISDYDTMNKYLMDYANQADVSHGREMDRITAANAAYMDQIAAAGGIQGDQFRRMAQYQAAQAAAAAAGRGGGGGGGGGRGGGGPVVDPSRIQPEDPAAEAAAGVTRESMSWQDFMELATANGIPMNNAALEQGIYQLYNDKLIDSASLYELQRQRRAQYETTQAVSANHPRQGISGPTAVTGPDGTYSNERVSLHPEGYTTVVAPTRNDAIESAFRTAVAQVMPGDGGWTSAPLVQSAQNQVSEQANNLKEAIANGIWALSGGLIK